MPVNDRIQLVEDISDSIVELPDWHKQELDARIQAYHSNSDSSSPWAEAKQRLLG